jgi:hypothetical protein
MYDRTVAEQLEAIFAADLAQSRRISREEWAGRPLSFRLRELLVAPLRSQL